MTDNGTFEIGIVMAGAVSGGAYTAGVMDFLIEALDAWDKAKGDNEDVPSHDVRIKVMTGTSAGAMNTALAAVMFNEDFEHVRAVPAPPKTAARNKAYKSWVEDIDIKEMLTSTDFANGKPVRSLLNGEPLDEIAGAALKYQWRGEPRKYLADVMPIYLAVTNLRGVPYSISFEGGPGHEMSLHGDVMKFMLTQPGGTGRTDAEAECPTGPIILPAADPGHGNWTFLKDAALASGAFPIGLPARELKRHSGYYDDRDWTVPGEGKAGPDGTCDCFQTRKRKPNWGGQRPECYEFMNVDGGVINNEPFEIARQELAGEPGRRNPRDPKKANRAVVMIDPFPNVVDFKMDYDAAEEGTLFNVIKRLLSVVVQNARFKPDEVALAGKPDEVALAGKGKPQTFSRFLIAPARTIGEGDNAKQDAKALVSGCLGAFGGFLFRQFRDHDYMLGRRNCQQFLRQHFVLDPENKLFDGWREKGNLKERLAIHRDKGEIYFPIIPLLPLPGAGDLDKPEEDLRKEIELPERPRITMAALEPIFCLARSRANSVVRCLVAHSEFKGVMRLLIGIAWDIKGRREVMKRIRRWVEKSLTEWDLLLGSGAPAAGSTEDLEDRGH
jgi:hypothetical protein